MAITVNGKKVAGIGKPGKSAYQAAVDGGYTKTETEFNDSLSKIDDLFTSVSDGKSAVAAAITDKGIETAADATFQTMADNIGAIQTGTDTSDATATEDQILADATAYVGGAKVTGVMPNNGSVSKTLDGTTTSFTIVKGYHDGTGTVSITPETKSATPTKSPQTITPTTGKVLTQVTVDAIPAAYQDVTGVTAAAADVLDGKFIVTSDGTKVEGTMTNNGAVNGTIDGLSATSYLVPAGYTSGGSVSLTNDIEDALVAI